MVPHPASQGLDEMPTPAIRPYPSQYSTAFTLRDGASVVIRPIRPEDEPLLMEFHATLSNQSVYLRYFHGMKLAVRTAHERLAQMCFIDYDRQIALVAESNDSEPGLRSILGVARLYKSRGGNDAECAFLVSDALQHQGLGTELASRMIHVAREEGLESLWADVLGENTGMQRVFRKFGFKIAGSDREVLTFKLGLNSRGADRADKLL